MEAGCAIYIWKFDASRAQGEEISATSEGCGLVKANAVGDFIWGMEFYGFLSEKLWIQLATVATSCGLVLPPHPMYNSSYTSAPTLPTRQKPYPIFSKINNFFYQIKYMISFFFQMYEKLILKNLRRAHAIWFKLKKINWIKVI